tara:strand:+ start:378 stop:920 length:543 start_codon:yes stop_codon:yes gene_type:complete
MVNKDKLKFTGLQRDILEFLFDNPRRSFNGREMARALNVSAPAVKKAVKFLLDNELILVEKKVTLDIRLNFGNPLVVRFKKLYNLSKVFDSGVVDYIYDTCLPNSIILFGSYSLGEDVEGSDIDIFVESKSRKLDLKTYENFLKRNISIFFEKDFSRLSKELRNNVVNGVVLKGYLRVFK